MTQKILFIFGAICILAGIIIAKISGDDNAIITMVGILMIAIGAIFMAINIILRLIERSNTTKNK